MAQSGETTTLIMLRKVLLGIFLFAVVGTFIELLLLEHFDTLAQRTPLILMAASLAVLAWHGMARDVASLRAFQAMMVLFMIGGTVGLYFHYNGNALFELDVAPDMRGFDLFWKAITGATPALAPGTMIQLGLVGMAFTFRHPLLKRNTTITPT